MDQGSRWKRAWLGFCQAGIRGAGPRERLRNQKRAGIREGASDRRMFLGRRVGEKGRSHGAEPCYRGGAKGIKETRKGDEPGEGGRWDKGGGGPGRCGGGARTEGVRFAGRGCC